MKGRLTILMYSFLWRRGYVRRIKKSPVTAFA